MLRNKYTSLTAIELSARGCGQKMSYEERERENERNKERKRIEQGVAEK